MAWKGLALQAPVAKQRSLLGHLKEATQSVSCPASLLGRLRLQA